MIVEFDIEVEGGRWLWIKAEMDGPEPDVGIFGYGCHGFIAYDWKGEKVEVTQAENDLICARASEVAQGRSWDDDDEGIW